MFYVFESTGQYKIKGRGTAYTTTNPVECADFSHLIGQQVQIDGVLCMVRGVERFAHSPPWRAGETISLLVEA